MAAYDVGDLVRATAVFADAAGTAVDPTAVTVKTKSPAGVVVTYTYGVDAAVVRDSVGHYHLDVDIPTAGAWTVRWAATGTGQCAAEDTFVVAVSSF